MPLAADAAGGGDIFLSNDDMTRFIVVVMKAN